MALARPGPWVTVETVEKTQPNSAHHEWLDLKGLTAYAAVSERLLRDWIHLRSDALPASQVGGKILVKKSTFDRWLEAHPIVPVDTIDVGAVANQIMKDIGGQKDGSNR
jgi:hypothetical protein